MTNHTDDPFDDSAVNNQDRQIGLNAILNVVSRYPAEEIAQLSTRKLLQKADAVAHYLHNGTLPDEGDEDN